MSSEVFDFARLIKPINAEDFFADYWEKKPIHIKREDHDYYSSLLTYQDLDEIISSGELRFPAIKLVPRGTNGFYRPETFTSNFKHGNDVFNGIPDIDKVFTEYRAGASVALPALELHWEPLGKLCRTLHAFFDHAVHANAYITAGNSKGFPPHYDPHEVFVMQIAGKKHWIIHEPPMHLPLVSQPFGAQPFAHDYDAPRPPLMEVDLEAGDLLYLPRGYVHSAATSDSFSAHVTIGVTVYTWIDLAAELFMSSMQMPRFRNALPPGFASNSEYKQILQKGIIERVNELLTSSDYDKLIDVFAKRVMAGRSKEKGSFQCNVSVE